jgi:hypothetical protein
MMRFILALLFQGVMPMFLGLGGGQYNATARQNEVQAQDLSNQLGQQQQEEQAQLNPFFSQEMKAQHSLTPGQANEMLTAAESGSGGAFGAAEGEMNRNAARTGNATSVAKSLDEMARDKAKVAAGAGENIAAQDVSGAKQLNQEGAAGFQGLYGTNVSGQLGAMKQANTDVSTEQATQGQTWLNQLNQLNSLAGGVAKDFGV